MQSSRWWVAAAGVFALACKGNDGLPAERANAGIGGMGDGAAGTAGSAAGEGGAGGSDDRGGSDAPPIEVQMPLGGSGGSDSVGGDAGVAGSVADAGMPTPILVSFPEWTLPDYVQCICNDESMHELCVDIDTESGPAMDVVCVPLCERHFGLSATGAEGLSSLCDRPMIGGPDHLSCHCQDGYVESQCADLGCFSDEQRLNLCTPFCAEHGGTLRTECEDFDYDLCIPLGPNLLTCGCENGEEMRVCTSNGCDEGIIAGEDCRSLCADQGGTAISGCAPDAPSCG